MKNKKRRLFPIVEGLREKKYTSLLLLLFLITITALVLSRTVFERLPEQEGTVGSVDTERSPTVSSDAEVTGDVYRPVEAIRPQKDESPKSSLDETSTTSNLIDHLDIAPPPDHGRPAWLTVKTNPDKKDSSSLIAAADPQGKRETGEVKQERAEQPDRAVGFRRLQMQDEKGEIPIDGLQKARKHVDRMRAFQQKRAIAAGKPDGIEVAGLQPGDWSWLGPGNIGGRIRSIIIDPNNANNIWAGSVTGGIWRSTNAGVSWQPVNDFQANLAVSTMVISPNPTIMYAGTGEGFGGSGAFRGGGIFQSVDGGNTWNLVGSTNPAAAALPGCGTIGISAPCPAFWTFISRLAIAPNGVMLAATGGNDSNEDGAGFTAGGIARSINGGASWIQTTNVYATDVDFDPNNSSNAIVAEITQCPAPPGPPCAGSVRRSVDGGQTWAAPVTFNPGIINASPTNDGRVELAYAPSSSNIIYASVNQNQGDVFRSSDSGQNFTQVDDVVAVTNTLGGVGWYANAIWVNPQDPTFLLVGGVNLFQSGDSGATFALKGDNFTDSAVHVDHHVFVANPTFDDNTDKSVYFGNDGGMYRVDDIRNFSRTDGWTELNNNLGITQFYGGAVSANGTIFGGTQDNGTIRVSPTPNLDPPYDPQNWSSIALSDGGYVAADPLDANFLYGETQNMGIFRSSDGGNSTTPIVAGITETASANFIAPLILDPGNANTLLAGSLSLWQNTGAKSATVPNWVAIKAPNPTIPPPPPPPAPPPAPVANPISAIAVSPTNSNFIVVGHNDGQIFLSVNGTNGTPTWSQINIFGIVTLPNRFVTRLAIDNTRSPNWIYATFGGFSNDNVYVTRDLGTTWIDVSGVTGSATDLPAIPVRSIVINPANNNFLYLGTEVGIFASEDAGATWQLPQDGPANVSVDELFFYQGDLLAATHGRGIYTTRAPVHGTNLCVGSLDPRCPNTNFCKTGPNPNDFACCNVGEWNCPCTWNNIRVPGPNDDVVVFCPISNAGGNIRSLTVLGGATLSITSLSTTNDVFNFGLITGAVAGQGSLLGRNILNVRPNGVGNRGIINVGQLFANDDVNNQGFIFASAVSGDNIYIGPDAHIGAPETTVRKDIHNDGSIVATNNLNLIALGPVDHILSGTGSWEAGNFNLRAHTGVYLETATLLNDLTLNVSGQTRIATFAALKQNSHNLTINGGGSLLSTGMIDLGTGALNLNLNQFVFSNPGNPSNEFGLRGTGTVNLNATGSGATFTGPVGAGAFRPSLRMLSGTVDANFSSSVGGSFTIDQGAVFNFNQGFADVGGDLTVNGTLGKSNSFTPTILNFNGTTVTNNGSILVNEFHFNNPGTAQAKSIAGTGSWSGTSMQMGPGTTTLMNDMTFSQGAFGVGTTSTLDLSAFNLTYTGSNMGSAGRVIGTGTLIMQPSSGTASWGGSGTNPFSCRIRIASGTVTPSGRASGPFTIDPGATLSGGGFAFSGNTFTNNGSIVSTGLSFLGFNFQPINQQLGGTGTFTGTGQLFITSQSTTTLFSDLTFAGSSIYNEGRLNTGDFTLTLPCPTGSNGPGEIIGNVRRTNLGACTGPMAFGSPFTTIQFTSGTPPTEITVNVGLFAPAGFPGAAQRTYFITPTGGNGYVATLRLHYLDSELNGNNESTLQLWRNNGSNWRPEGATNRNTADNWVEYNNVTQFSPWAVSQIGPTAAGVLVGGRVFTSSGRPISRAFVNITNSTGSSRTAITNTFGYYRFDNVAAGETYVFSVSHRRFLFATQIVTVNQALKELNFTAEQ